MILVVVVFNSIRLKNRDYMKSMFINLLGWINDICDSYERMFSSHEKTEYLSKRDSFTIVIFGFLCGVVFLFGIHLLNNLVEAPLNIIFDIIQVFFALYFLVSIIYILFSIKYNFGKNEYEYIMTLPLFILMMISYRLCYRFIPYRGRNIRVLRREKLKKLM